MISNSRGYILCATYFCRGTFYRELSYSTEGFKIYVWGVSQMTGNFWRTHLGDIIIYQYVSDTYSRILYEPRDHSYHIG